VNRRHAVSLAALAAAPFVALAAAPWARAQTPPPAGSAQAAQAAQSAMSGIYFDMALLAKAPGGSWADYTMSKIGTDKSVTIRYALVAKTVEKLGLEIDTPSPQGDVFMRLDFGARPNAWKLVGGRMQQGEQKIEMPKEQVDAAPPIKNGALPGELVGTESVTIPAGTFACKHYRNRLADDPQSPVMDMWISDAVAPTGIVKSELSPLGIRMQLAATGTGAQPKTK
jgi:hypothetical protein